MNMMIIDDDADDIDTFISLTMLTDKSFKTFQVKAYLKVGELGVVEVGVDVQRGAHHQQGFKLV